MTTPGPSLPPHPSPTTLGNHHSALWFCEFDYTKWNPDTSGIIQYSSFCGELLSLSIMSSRFIYIVAWFKIPFLFKAKQLSIVHVPYILFILSSAGEHWDSFYPLVILNIGVQIPTQVLTFNSLGYIHSSRIAQSWSFDILFFEKPSY